jgi:hypothetical protein
MMIKDLAKRLLWAAAYELVDWRQIAEELARENRLMK